MKVNKDRIVNITINVILFLVILLSAELMSYNNVKNNNDRNELKHLNDSLEYISKIIELNHQLDSIKSKIDTVYIDKIKLKYVYQQKNDTIWNQSADDDWVYYTKFLSSRFSSDSSSIKTN